jgi:hypothetical protein
MKKVTFTFVGFQSDEIAQKFYTWIVDGGLEDSIIDLCSTDEASVKGIMDFNESSLDIAIESISKESDKTIP